MKKGFIIKSVVAIVVWIIYSSFLRIFYPVLINEQALNQFNDTTESFTDFQMYQQFWDYAWIVPLIICLVIFYKEIKSTIIKINL